MPNRILRDWTDSERVNSISESAEVMLIRLMMKADDFGSYHGNPAIIRANCFPFKLDMVTIAGVCAWIEELENAGLIIVYSSGGKTYVRIVNFGQRLRAMRNKFPEPSESDESETCQQLAATRRNSPPEEKPNPKRNQKPNPNPNPKAFVDDADFQKIEISILADELKLDEHWIETVAYSLSCEILKVRDLIEKFVKHLGTQKITEKTKKDFLTHFMNWSRKKVNDVKNNQARPIPASGPGRKFGTL